MRNFKNLVIVTFMLFVYGSALALGQEVDPSDAGSVVAYLTPFIVFGAVQVVKLIKPLIPIWILGIIVPGLSAAVAFLQTATDNADSWLIQFGLGLAATFVHQIYKQLTTAKIK